MLTPKQIDEKRSELAAVVDQLSNIAKLEAKDIKFEEAASLKKRADEISLALQESIKAILSGNQ